MYDFVRSVSLFVLSCTQHSGAVRTLQLPGVSLDRNLYLLSSGLSLSGGSGLIDLRGVEQVYGYTCTWLRYLRRVIEERSNERGEGGGGGGE